MYTLILRAAKKYNEPEVIEYSKEIAKYIDLIDGKVDCDGQMFKAEDESRLYRFLQENIDPQADEVSKIYFIFLDT